MGNIIELNKYRNVTIDLKIEIYEGKVEEGYNGVEWLILNLNEDDYMYQHEETTGLEIVKEILLDGADFHQSIKDWAHFTANGFYRKYKMNWWCFGDAALVYLHKMRKNEYDSYLNLMGWIFDKTRRKHPVSKRG